MSLALVDKTEKIEDDEEETLTPEPAPAEALADMVHYYRTATTDQILPPKPL